MAHIIHNVQGWKVYLEKFNPANTVGPDKYPVLSQLIKGEDGAHTAVFFTPDQAISLVSYSNPADFVGVETKTLNKSLKVVTNALATAKMAKKKQLVAETPSGESITWTSTAPFEIGQKVMINGKECTVTGVGSSDMPPASIKIEATDPITGVQASVEVLEEGEPEDFIETAVPAIPGMGKIPVDKSKLQDGIKVAQMGDPTEHVLDIERSV